MARPRVAFVGSGGAAKGVAHLGVLRAMQELGIEADICVGASAGAIAGAFYAQGYTPAQMIDWFRPFWQRGLIQAGDDQVGLGEQSRVGGFGRQSRRPDR